MISDEFPGWSRLLATLQSRTDAPGGIPGGMNTAREYRPGTAVVLGGNSGGLGRIPRTARNTAQDPCFGHFDADSCVLAIVSLPKPWGFVCVLRI